MKMPEPRISVWNKEMGIYEDGDVLVYICRCGNCGAEHPIRMWVEAPTVRLYWTCPCGQANDLNASITEDDK